MKHLRLLLCFLLIGISASAQTKKPAAKPKPKSKPAPVAVSGAELDAEIDALFQQGNYPALIVKANEKLKMNPHDTVRLVLKTLAYAMTRNKEMAVSTVKQIYSQPETAALFIATLPTRLSAGVMKEDGLWYAEEAIRMSPHGAVPYMMKAAYLTDDSAFDKAKEAATLGFSYASDTERRQMGGTFAQILLKSGDREQAFRIIGELTARYPDATELASSYYAMLLQEKRWNEAMQELRRMMRLTPDDSLRLQKEMVYLYHDMGRDAEACAGAASLAALSETYGDLLAQFGCPQAFADLSPGKVKSFVYDVDYHGTSYDFVVNPKSVDMQEGISFAWRMTVSEQMKGNITIGRGALDTAHGQMNAFAAGDRSLDNLTTVWVSRAVYNDLKQKGSTVMAASEEGPKMFRIVRDNTGEGGYETVSIGAEGKTKLLKTIHARSEDDKEDLWINDDPANPVITRMSIGWKIKLRSIF